MSGRHEGTVFEPFNDPDFSSGPSVARSYGPMGSTSIRSCCMETLQPPMVATSATSPT
jgi:hypothetical protein